jgi:peptidyl-tRNA hydrolase
MYRLALSAPKNIACSRFSIVNSARLTAQQIYGPKYTQSRRFLTTSAIQNMSVNPVVASAAGTDAAPPEPTLQYVVLRRDLWKEMNWPLGSIVAQGCHAATAALWLSKDQPITQTYCAPENMDHMHKVVLEATGDVQLRDVAQKLEEAGILHKLWIEQPENFVTCLATAPYPKSTVAPFMKKLKLCKGT